jgi:hypothetical protein
MEDLSDYGRRGRVQAGLECLSRDLLSLLISSKKKKPKTARTNWLIKTASAVDITRNCY